MTKLGKSGVARVCIKPDGSMTGLGDELLDGWVRQTPAGYQVETYRGRRADAARMYDALQAVGTAIGYSAVRVSRAN